MHSAHTLGLKFGAHQRDWFQAVDFMHCESAVTGTGILFPDLNRQNACTGFKESVFS